MQDVINKVKYDFNKLKNFLDSRIIEIHTETMDNRAFIDPGVESIKDCVHIGDKVLDVGCGHGYAMDKFKELGADPVGITMHEDDYKRNIEKGNDVHYMDMAFLDFPDETFDIVWARQCLEHSIFPFFMLHEISRVTKKGGLLYVEVPAPDTCGLNEEDPNHYSVFGGQMWAVLIRKSGYQDIQGYSIEFQNNDRLKGSGVGIDSYLRFIARKVK